MGKNQKKTSLPARLEGSNLNQIFLLPQQSWVFNKVVVDNDKVTLMLYEKCQHFANACFFVALSLLSPSTKE
jgi:hypothetical protein